MTAMKTLEYALTFTSPAFMGNAEQNAQWRTPPIKALLRQWWRVAYAAEKKFAVDVAAMRREEGLLFGHAWLDDDHIYGSKINARKSRVLIRFDQDWLMGSQKGVEPMSKGLETSYAWFGLIKRGHGISDRNAIKAASNASESRRILKLAVPEECEDRFHTIMRLISTFGMVGSRSRGGWGSIHIEGINTILPQEMIDGYSQNLLDCLKRDWPVSLACDNKGLLLWEGTQQHKSWDSAMTYIASERKKVRSNLKLGQADLRPLLGFATPGRMPSPLRWKVIPSQNGSLIVRIFSMPHRVPEDAGKSFSKEQYQTAWSTIGGILDKSTALSRSKP